MTPQHQIALAKANEIRLEQARVHRSIAAVPRPEGLIRVADLLEDPSETVARMQLHYLLRSIRRNGWSLAQKLVASAGFPTSRMLNWRVGPGVFRKERSLSERQRRALSVALRERA